MLRDILTLSLHFSKQSHKIVKGLRDFRASYGWNIDFFPLKIEFYFFRFLPEHPVYDLLGNLNP